MEYPLVSAIVLCYNHARFVTECLDGVRLQNYPNLELIINDDASKDDSAAAIQQWLAANSVPHRFIRSEVNHGVCRSLNNALALAKGKYISGIAADDVWLPGKLAHQVEMMEHLPERVGVLYSNALQIDELGKELPQTFLETYHQSEPMPEGALEEVLWKGNFIPAMTTLIRRACFDQVGPYDESLCFEDWDMWLRLARHYEFAYSNRISAKYRYLPTSMVRSQFARINNSMCRMCVKHLREGKLRGNSRAWAIHLLRNRAIYCFESAAPGHIRNLLAALRYKMSAGLVLRLAFAASGLGPRSFERLRSAFALVSAQRQS